MFACDYGAFRNNHKMFRSISIVWACASLTNKLVFAAQINDFASFANTSASTSVGYSTTPFVYNNNCEFMRFECNLSSHRFFFWCREMHRFRHFMFSQTNGIDSDTASSQFDGLIFQFWISFFTIFFSFGSLLANEMRRCCCDCRIVVDHCQILSFYANQTIISSMSLSTQAVIWSAAHRHRLSLQQQAQNNK